MACRRRKHTKGIYPTPDPSESFDNESLCGANLSLSLENLTTVIPPNAVIKTHSAVPEGRENTYKPLNQEAIREDELTLRVFVVKITQCVANVAGLRLDRDFHFNAKFGDQFI